MYNPYFSNNRQQTADRIDNQIMQLQQMKEQLLQAPQMSSPTNLTQNFQIASNTNSMKFANSIDEVAREQVFVDTPFFSRDFSTLWIKNSKGDIKAYTLAEIVQKDEKDIQIEMLKLQIEEMKKGMVTDEHDNEHVSSTASEEKPTSS